MTKTWMIVMAAAALVVAVGAQSGGRRSEQRQPQFWQLAIDEDHHKEEATVDLDTPSAVTVCSDALAQISLSIDGKHWHEMTIGGCAQVPTVRFVKLKKTINDSANAQVYATY